MTYKNVQLSRNNIINIFKSHTNNVFSFEVNAYKLPCYKPTYFRIYVDDCNSEYFELYFYNGELRSFGYNRSLYSKNLIDTEFGNYRVVTKLPPAIKKFMQHLITVMEDEDYPYEMTDNAKFFLKLIRNNVK